jgi:sec-independent protein translocase protein TatA
MTQFLFIQNIGGGGMLVIALFILIFFGGKKIPELMRGLGSGIREFNDAKNKVKKEIEDGMQDDQQTNVNQNKKD